MDEFDMERSEEFEMVAVPRRPKKTNRKIVKVVLTEPSEEDYSFVERSLSPMGPRALSQKDLCLEMKELGRVRMTVMKGRIQTSNRGFANIYTLMNEVKMLLLPDSVEGATPEQLKKIRADISEKRRIRADMIYYYTAGRKKLPPELRRFAAICAPYIEPQVVGMKIAEERELFLENAMCERAVLLPAHTEWCSIKGIATQMFACVIGQSGDLSNYPTPSHLHSRFGVVAYQGHAYSTWRSKSSHVDRSLTAEEWTKAGYNPQRRSVIFLPAKNIQMQNTDTWKALYCKQKAMYAEKHPDYAKMPAHKHGLAMVSKQLLTYTWLVWNQKRLDPFFARHNAGLMY